MNITLNNEQEAFALLNKLVSGEFSDEQAENLVVTFSESISTLEIKIDGENYHGTVPGELARGLWEFQAALYRAGAFATYGVADIRKLTNEQRAQFELVFDVKEGSTDLIADLKEVMENLKGVFDGMSGIQKSITLITIALIISGLLGFQHHSDNETEIAKERQRTEQLKVVKDAALGRSSQIISKYEQATEIGVTSIAKGASDATQIKAGRVTLDRAAIIEINKKSDRTQSTAEVIDSNFRVYEMQTKDTTKDACVIASPDGREFNITIHHDEFSETLRRKIWDAAEKRQTIRLEVSVVVNSDGNIRKSQVLTIY